MRFDEPVFVISVAARLVKMHPQTLRKYEREGLVEPSRTHGNLRLYSDHDIERLRQVKYLVEQRGLNVAGVQLALEVSRQLREMKQRHADAKRANGRGASLEEDIESLLELLGYQEMTGPPVTN